MGLGVPLKPHQVELVLDSILWGLTFGMGVIILACVWWGA